MSSSRLQGWTNNPDEGQDEGAGRGGIPDSSEFSGGGGSINIMGGLGSSTGDLSMRQMCPPRLPPPSLHDDSFLKPVAENKHPNTLHQPASSQGLQHMNSHQPGQPRANSHLGQGFNSNASHGFNSMLPQTPLSQPRAQRPIGSPSMANFHEMPGSESPSPHNNQTSMLMRHDMLPRPNPSPTHSSSSTSSFPPRFVNAPPMHAAQPMPSASFGGGFNNLNAVGSSQHTSPSPTPSPSPSPFHGGFQGQGQLYPPHTDQGIIDMMAAVSLDPSASPPHGRPRSGPGSASGSPSRMLHHQPPHAQQQLFGPSDFVGGGRGGSPQQQGPQMLEAAGIAPYSNMMAGPGMMGAGAQGPGAGMDAGGIMGLGLKGGRKGMMGMGSMGPMGGGMGGGMGGAGVAGAGGLNFGQQDMPPKGYKTVICKFWENNMCTKGANCTFAHGPEDLKRFAGAGPAFRGGAGVSPVKMDRYKTKLCLFHMQSRCCKGPHCPYAHGMDELRTAMPPGVLSALHHRFGLGAQGGVGLPGMDLAGARDDQALRQYLDEVQLQQMLQLQQQQQQQLQLQQTQQQLHQTALGMPGPMDPAAGVMGMAGLQPMGGGMGGGMGMAAGGGGGAELSEYEGMEQQAAALRYMERQRHSFNMNPLQQQAQARAIQQQQQQQQQQGGGGMGMMGGNQSPRHQQMVDPSMLYRQPQGPSAQAESGMGMGGGGLGFNPAGMWQQGDTWEAEGSFEN